MAHGNIEDSITYLDGDATQPHGCEGNKIIAHIVNNKGGGVSGFVVPLGALYPRSELAYKRWSDVRSKVRDDFLTYTPPTFELGETQFVTVAPRIMVANMCAQDGYPSRATPHPCDIDAVTSCIGSVFHAARRDSATIHMPRIGTGLGGADWDEILSAMYDARIIGPALPVPHIYVYDF